MRERDQEQGAGFEDRVRFGLHRLAARTTTSPDAWEQINAAPARWRRPRVRLAVALPAAAVATAAAVALLVALGRGHPGPRSVRTATTGPGSVQSAAGPGGRVAFIDAGRLDVLGPDATPARVLAASGVASSPKWSPDGQWLAYLFDPTPSTGRNALHVVRADGTGDRAVLVGPVYAFQWSPTEDVLAASPQDRPGGGLVVIPVGGGPVRHIVPVTVSVFSFAWSRDGSELAYTVPHVDRSDELFTVRVGGGTTHRLAYAPPRGTGLILAGWWPDGRGVLFWNDPAHSASLESDGLELETVALGATRPRSLGRTLVFLPWLRWSPDGQQLLVVEGGGRLPSTDKHLALCRPSAGTCHALDQPAGTVSLDPAWSSDGSRMAFVRASASSSTGPDLVGWYATRELWVADSDGSHALPVAGAAPGAAAPSWAADGASLRYATAADIRVVVVDSGHDRVVASELSLPDTDGLAGPDAYGKQPWGGIATWAPPPQAEASAAPPAPPAPTVSPA